MLGGVLSTYEGFSCARSRSQAKSMFAPRPADPATLLATTTPTAPLSRPGHRTPTRSVTAVPLTGAVAAVVSRRATLRRPEAVGYRG